MPSRAVSTRSRTSCKGRFIPGAQEGWRPCCSRTTAPETGPSPFLAVLSNGEGRCRGEARCTWKTLPGSGRGTRKTASGGAAWGAGPSCGSYAHCGFDAHDLRRGQQTSSAKTLSDNRGLRPARQKVVYAYREIAAGGTRSPGRIACLSYRGFGGIRRGRGARPRQPANPQRSGAGACCGLIPPRVPPLGVRDKATAGPRGRGYMILADWSRRSQHSHARERMRQ